MSKHVTTNDPRATDLRKTQNLKMYMFMIIIYILHFILLSYIIYYSFSLCAYTHTHTHTHTRTELYHYEPTNILMPPSRQPVQTVGQSSGGGGGNCVESGREGRPFHHPTTLVDGVRGGAKKGSKGDHIRCLVASDVISMLCVCVCVCACVCVCVC